MTVNSVPQGKGEVNSFSVSAKASETGESRTPDLSVRSAALYPLSYGLATPLL